MPALRHALQTACVHPAPAVGVGSSRRSPRGEFHTIGGTWGRTVELAFSSTTAAFRCSPRNFARFIGDFRNAALNASWSSPRISRASVAASFPAMNSRARNGESSANSCENFTFHAHTLWEMCRYNRFMVELDTGRRTLRKTSDFESARTRGTAGDSPVAGRGRA